MTLLQIRICIPNTQIKLIGPAAYRYCAVQTNVRGCDTYKCNLRCAQNTPFTVNVCLVAVLYPYLDFFNVRRRDVPGLASAAARPEPPVFIASFKDQKAFFSSEMKRVGLRGSKSIQGAIHLYQINPIQCFTAYGDLVKVSSVFIFPWRSDLKGVFTAWPDRCVYLQRRSASALQPCPIKTAGGARQEYAPQVA